MSHGKCQRKECECRGLLDLDRAHLGHHSHHLHDKTKRQNTLSQVGQTHLTEWFDRVGKEHDADAQWNCREGERQDILVLLSGRIGHHHQHLYDCEEPEGSLEDIIPVHGADVVQRLAQQECDSGQYDQRQHSLSEPLRVLAFTGAGQLVLRLLEHVEHEIQSSTGSHNLTGRDLGNDPERSSQNEDGAGENKDGGGLDLGGRSLHRLLEPVDDVLDATENTGEVGSCFAPLLEGVDDIPSNCKECDQRPGLEDGVEYPPIVAVVGHVLELSKCALERLDERLGGDDGVMTNGGQNLADALDKLDEVMPPGSSLVLELKISDEVLGGVPAVLDRLGILAHERLKIAERLMERFGVEVEVQSCQILEDAPDTSSKRRKNTAQG